MTNSPYENIIAAALTAKGSGPLPFDVMMEVVKIGSQLALTVSTIDATCDNGWTPRPDVGFYLSAGDAEKLSPEPSDRALAAYQAVCDAYRGMSAEAEGLEFEVWFWRG